MGPWASLVIVGLLAVVACAPAPPGPTSAPVKPAAPAAPKAAAAPTAAVSAKPVPKGPEAWEQEWERVLQAARQEGKVAVLGPPGSDTREALVRPFEQRYGIEVDWLGSGSGPQVTRVAQERDAGLFAWDVHIGGTSPHLRSFKPMGALEPVESALILPEVKDPQKWLEGKLWFADKTRLSLVMGLSTRPAFAINSQLVKVEDFRSYKDLLEPRWRGRISMGRDPRTVGPTNAIFTFYSLHPELGPEFIRELVRREPLITGDDRSALDSLARGATLVDLGPSETVGAELIRAGLPIQYVPPQGLREGGYLSPAGNALAFFNRPAHPNAARVYANWLLSQEGQTALSVVTGIASLRLDVPSDHVEAWRRPVPHFMDTYTEASEAATEPLLELLNEILRR